MLPLYSIKGIYSSGISLKQFALATEGTQGAPLAFVSKANPKIFTFETLMKLSEKQWHSTKEII